MCTMVYLASDKPLPIIHWDEEHPSFHTETLQEIDVAEKAAAVQSQFSKSFVYRLGSNQRCGCGFAYFDEFEDGNYEQAYLDAAEKSRESLAAYLADALNEEDSLEIWICWDGDEDCDTEDRRETHPQDFLNPAIYASEKILFTVKNAPT